MGELRESSVLFSLQGLMELEQERVEAEAADAARRVESERRERELALRLAREEEASKLRAEEEARRREQAARAEEAARLEALRLAEVERVRIETEHRARMDVAAAQASHERALAALREDRSRKRWARFAIGGAAIAFGLLAGGLALWFGKLKPDAERAARDQSISLAARDARLEALERDIRRRQEQIDGLRGAMRQREEDRLRRDQDEQRRLREERRDKPAPAPAPAPRPPAPRPAKVCPEGDPMCGFD